MIDVRINGERKSFEKSLSVSELLLQLGYQDDFVAVAINREHVPRKEFSSTKVDDQYDVDVLAPMAGG